MDEFATLAEKHLVIGITKDNLVESITTWFRVCQANRDLYVSLSRIPDRRFPAAIRQVWARHLNVMLDIDAMPKNDFRMIHFEYVPRSNTNVTYAWLTQPHLRGIEPITLAQFINTQRLNYLPHAITDSSPLRTPPSLERLKFVASEVVATAKVRELLRIGGEKYLRSHFTDSEILQAERSKISLQYYARFLAAKCVICKCISNHVDERVFPYISIDIQDDQTVDVMLLGWASSLAQECNINHIILNVSYESEYAAAFAIATA